MEHKLSIFKNITAVYRKNGLIAEDILSLKAELTDKIRIYNQDSDFYGDSYIDCAIKVGGLIIFLYNDNEGNLTDTSDYHRVSVELLLEDMIKEYDFNDEIEKELYKFFKTKK